MNIDPQDHDGRALYRLLTSIVVPRPIAWVSTRSANGVLNLAPFSYFNIVSHSPPLLSIAVGRRRGERKDTTHNASRTGELVVNVVTQTNLHAMVTTSGDYEPGVDEFEKAGLTPLASDRVAPPRVKEAPIQLECKTREIFEVAPGVADLVIAEVVLMHVADELWSEDFIVSPTKLDPVARLGGDDYCGLGPIEAIKRPPS